MGKKFNNRPNVPHKTLDGEEIWVSRSVAVNCLVIFKTEKFYILAEKRGSALSDESGKWCFPCGYLDWDETIKDAVIREVYEETGLDLQYYIDNNKVVINNLNQPWYIDSNPKSNRQNVTLRHGCVILGEELPPITTENSDLNEIEELKWIEYEDIDNYEWAFGHDQIIKEYFKKY